MTREELAEKLLEQVVIDLETGEVHPRAKPLAGRRCIALRTGKSRLYSSTAGLNLPVHHLVWYKVHGSLPPQGMEIDHKDRDDTNNRPDNLRLATRSQNCANRGLFKGNTSGFKGVTWDKARERWRAQIVVNGKSLNLGRFREDQKEEAARAHDKAALEHFGEFAVTNESLGLL